MSLMTGGQALAGQLERAGVRHVFGVPGVQLDHALDALTRPDSPITYVVARHEQGAAHMAEGYARTSGRPGVCMVVPGPGVLNALTAIATGYACSSPLVLLAADLPRPLLGRGLGMLHEVGGQAEMLGSVTKWSARVERAEDLPGLVQEALRRAVAGRPRPVALSIPADLFSAGIDAGAGLDVPVSGGLDVPVSGGLDVPVSGDRDGPVEGVEALAAALLGARRPVFYAGWGVQAAGAGDQLLDLAVWLGMPVVTSRNGSGALPAWHPLALPSPAASPLLASADLVVAVGTRFLTDRGAQVPVPDGATLALVNVDPLDLGAPRRPDLVLQADARRALEELLRFLRRESVEPAADWRPTELEAIRRQCHAEISAVEPQWAFVRALREMIPEDGILVNELTQVGYLASVGYPVEMPRTLLGAGYQGTLGYGYPTALGAKAAHPGRAVVSINGDGGFGYNLQELATARHYGLGVVAVVFDDRAFGNVKRIQTEEFGSRLIGSDLSEIDFVGLAQAFGVSAARARTPTQFAGLLKEALGDPGPALIHVPVGAGG